MKPHPTIKTLPSNALQYPPSFGGAGGGWRGRGRLKGWVLRSNPPHILSSFGGAGGGQRSRGRQKGQGLG